MVKEKSAPKKRLGRPPKRGERAEHVLAVRLTTEDKALVDALVADERARFRSLGVLAGTAALVNASDLVRSLLQQEAERRKLSTRS